MKENFGNKKIFDTFFVVFFVVLTILFLLFSWLLLEKNNKFFSQKYNEYFGQVSLNYNTQISKELKKELGNLFVGIEGLLDNVAVGDEAVFDCPTFYNDNKQILVWYLYDTTDNIVCDDWSLDFDSKSLLMYDSEFFSKGYNDFWLSPSFNLNGKNLLKIYKKSSSVDNEGVFTAVMIVDLENFFRDYLLEDGLWYGTNFNVVSNSGQIVWSNDKSLLNKNIEDDYINKVFFNFSDALNILQKARTGNVGFEVFEYLAQEQVASYIRVPIVSNYYWSVILYTPSRFVQSEILLDYTTNSYTFFYFVSFLLIVFLLVLYFLVRRNLSLHLEVDDTKKEMIEETKKFKMSEIKLNKTVEELEELNSIMVNRELKMIELKIDLKKKDKKK